MSGNDVEITVHVKTDKSGLTSIRRDAENEGRATGAAFSRGAEGGFDSFLSLLQRGAGSASGVLGGLTNNIYLMAAAAAVGGAAASELAGFLFLLPAAGGAAAGVLGTLGLALHGVADALGAQGGLSAEMAKSGASAAAMARQIRDAVDSVNDARQAAARVAEDSARRIEDAERNTARVARDGAEAVAAAKARVAEAAQDSAQAVEAADRNLADTEEQVARQIEAAQKALADARTQAAKALADAEAAQARTARDGARAVADALRAQEKTTRSGADAVARASDRIEKALKREQDAQEDLSQARQDAARDLEDLQAKVAGYGADEQSAQARVARAAEELRKVNASRRFSDVDRLEAAAELAEAEQHLADVQREGKQDAADLAKIQSQGLDATKRVQDAAERVASAHEAVVDATTDRAQAEQDAADANTAAAQRVTEAREQAAERQADAAQRVADAEQSGAERIQDAQDRLTQAKQDGARRIQDAERAVAQAVEDGAKRQAEARAALARAERSASEANQDAQRAEADARREAAQAQQDAAERVADAEQRLNDTYAQQREQAAQAAAATDTYAAQLAKLAPNAQAFVEAIRELRPEWEALQLSVQQNAFAGLAQTVKALSDTYLPVLRQWLTLIATDLNGMVQYAADALMKPESVQAVNDVLQYTHQFLDNCKTALGDFVSGLLGLVSVGAQYLPQFGTWIADIAKRFAEWANSKEGRAEIKDWIERAFTAFGNLWAICKDVWAIFKAVCTALGIDSGAGLLQGLRDLCDWLRKVAENPQTQSFLRGVGDVIRWVWEGIKFILPTIGDLIRWLVNLANNAMTIAGKIKNGWNGLWDGLTRGVKAAVNGCIDGLNWLIDAANGAIRAINALPGPDLPLFGKFGHLAHGGIAGGMAVVGENGPELVRLPQGSQVYPSGQSRGMAERLGGQQSGPARIELVVGGNTDGALAQALMKMMRTGQIQIRQSQLVAG